MTHREILELLLKIETDPNLTGEEIEFIWGAVDRQYPIKVFTDSVFFRCGDCGRCVAKLHEYCWFCGQKLDWSEE